MLGLLAFYLLPITAGAQEPQVTRTPGATQVSAGQLVTITMTPSGFAGFYAVKETLGTLELTANTADNYASETFIMLGATPFTYTVRVPATAQPGQEFPITGQWWNDPNNKLAVTPAQTVLVVPALPTPTPAATPTPTSMPVPTLSEWGLIIMTLLLAGLVYLRLRRRPAHQG